MLNCLNADGGVVFGVLCQSKECGEIYMVTRMLLFWNNLEKHKHIQSCKSLQKYAQEVDNKSNTTSGGLISSRVR